MRDLRRNAWNPTPANRKRGCPRNLTPRDHRRVSECVVKRKAPIAKLGLRQRNKSRKSETPTARVCESKNNQNVKKIRKNLSRKKRLEVFMNAKHWQEHKSANKCKSKSTDLNSCKYCKETFLTSKLLKNHRKTHKPNELLHVDRDEPDYKFDVCQDLYICNVCSAEFQDETEAKGHAQSHKEVIFCLVCKKTFSSHYDLGIHSITHDPERKKFPFYCQECGKGFKHLKTYHEHQNVHEGKKPYVCVVCEKGFAYQKYLQVHQVRSHQVGTTGQKIENKCTTCNRYFYKPEGLAEHIEVCYKRKKKPKSTSPVKAFLCDTCGQTFTEKSKLLEHLRVHKGDFPYVCTWCGKRFPVKSYLKTHERVHTGEKPYSCEFCGRRFGQHAPFRVHRRLHTGERPYVCDFCNKGFTTNQGLKLHKKNCPDNQLNKRLKVDKVVASSVDSNVSSQHSIFGLVQY
ncbi:hypothetical protein HUJ04_003594 [Dendroctonus ponderosae]|nr:hypothetical protein HUJ04_003594 [Dendroctonus ponderosae]